LENNPDLTLFTNRAWRDEFSAPVVVYDELYVTVDRWANATDGVTINAPEVYDKNDTRLRKHITNYLVSSTNGETWLDLTSMYPERRIDTPKGPELKPKFAHVVHGHARAAPPRDRLQLSLSFLAVVILCNAVKLGVMLWVLLSMKDSDFVVTLGDAAASFIHRPDPTTESFCVFTKEAVQSEVAHSGLRRPKRQGVETVELNTYHGSKLDPLDDFLLAQDGSLQGLQLGARKTLEGDSGRSSSAVWRVRRVPYSSSIGKDMGTGSGFLYVPLPPNLRYKPY
jgi:hypothetical protein